MSEYKEGETALSSLYKDKCKDLEETILSMDEEATELANKVIKLEAENARLRAALEKFADESNWLRDEEYRIYEWQGVEDVPFNIAKEALKEQAE